jgi:hypothetical protein
MICGIALPLTAREITLGISESYNENQNTVNNIFKMLLLAYVKNDDFNFPNCELSIFM